jgi:hypothetical protein
MESRNTSYQEGLRPRDRDRSQVAEGREDQQLKWGTQQSRTHRDG